MTATLLSGAVLVALCSAIAVSDMLTRRIPDPLTLLLGLAGGVATIAATGSLPWERGIAALVVMGLLWSFAYMFRHLRGTAGLGLGDVKMAGAAALWVAPWNLPLLLMLACLAALLAVAIVILSGRRLDRLTRIPFGPFIGLGLVVVWTLEASDVPTLVPVGL